VPAPELRAQSPSSSAEIGIISLGGCHAAVLEAVDRMRHDGRSVDYMRIRAFPFPASVRQFIEAHERCYVVEQNRDGQLRSLLAIETGIARDRMMSVLDYGGLPLTADRVVLGVLGTGVAAGQSPHVASPSLAQGAAV
jgi:2-oxoglutarate/2-oxoacid ferredoxin oxidoreductase subunit alpha